MATSFQSPHGNVFSEPLRAIRVAYRNEPITCPALIALSNTPMAASSGLYATRWANQRVVPRRLQNGRDGHGACTRESLLTDRTGQFLAAANTQLLVDMLQIVFHRANRMQQPDRNLLRGRPQRSELGALCRGPCGTRQASEPLAAFASAGCDWSRSARPE